MYHAFVGHAAAAVDHGKVTTGALRSTAPALLLVVCGASLQRRAVGRRSWLTALFRLPRRADQLQPMRNTLRSLQQVMRQLLEEQKYQTTRDSVHIASA